MSVPQPPKSGNTPDPDKQDEHTEEEKKGAELRQASNYYLKYSGMAFQMGGIILLGVWLGKKLDQWLATEPYLMVVMALLSIFAALYVTLKDLVNPKPTQKKNKPT